MSWSHVTITGHVVRAPRRRVADSGKVVVTLGLEIVNKLVGETGESNVVRSSVEVVCFNDLAENAHSTLRVGMRVVVAGLIAIRTWERAGGKGSSIDLIATDIGVSLRAATAVVTSVPERLAAAS
jgi:single-strand DNA-binding protein